MTDLTRPALAALPMPHLAGAISRGSRTGTSGLLSIFVFWLCLPLAGGVLLLVLFGGGVPLSDGLKIVGASVVHALVWTPITVLVFRLTARFNFEETHRLVLGLMLVATGVVVACAAGALVSVGFYLLHFPLSRGGTSPPSFGQAVLRMLPGSLLLYAGTAVVGLLRDASHRARVRREEAVRLRGQLAESRLQVLRTQLNPHFLFNTLNAVSALVDEDARGARRMIARLSELLRYALDGATAAEIPLHEELTLVGGYLEIVEIRYQGVLDTAITAADDVRDALVPSLILQPLAENAMQHGVGRVGGRGRIEVQAARAGDRLVLRVLDTGGEARSGAAVGSQNDRGGRVGGLGLRHTRERLEALYGTAQRLVLEPRPEGGTVAVIELPYHTTPMVRSLAAESA